MVYSIPLWIATGVSLYISLVDIREMRIPNRILLPGLLLTLISMLVIALTQSDLLRFSLATLGGSLALLLFFLIHLIRPDGLGMGDVKFAALIGLALSWASFPIGLYGLAIAFVSSAIYSTFSFVIPTGKRSRVEQMKRMVPFAPFMLFGLLFMELGLLI